MPESEISSLPNRESRLRLVLLGPQGYRAGWRVLLFVVLLLVLMAASNSLLTLSATLLGAPNGAPAIIAQELILFVDVLLATLVMKRLERRPLSDYGIPLRRMFRQDFWVGALWGFVMLSATIGLMAAAGSYSPGKLALSPTAIPKYALLWALAFLVVGLFEEFTFRGYPQFAFTEGMGFWRAAGITCLLFALAHGRNPGETWVGLVEIVFIAFFLCLALRRTGTLWFAIGWHMAFDWGESFFYSTSNSGFLAAGHLFHASLSGSKWLSGGSVGPEGSVFDLIVTIAGILLLAKLYPDAKYPAIRRDVVAGQEPATPASGTEFTA